MKIQKLTITDDEMREAVRQWLTKHGISLPVDEVAKPYSHYTYYEVTFVEPIQPSPAAEATATPATV